MKRKLIFPLSLALMGVISLVGCNTSELTSSSVQVSSQTTDVTSSSPIQTISSNSDSESESTPSTSSLDTLTIKDVIKVTVDKIPELKVKQEIDLTNYIHCLTSSNQEVPLENILANISVSQASNETDTGIIGGYNLDNQLELTALYEGKVTIDVNVKVSVTKTISASVTTNIVSNDEIAQIVDNFETLSDNYTVTMGEYIGVRTEKYFASNDSGYVCLDDGKLYKFTSDDILQGTNFNVLPTVEAEDGLSAIQETVPSMDITSTSLIYEPMFEMNDLEGEYAIVDSNNITSLMNVLGLGSVIQMQDGYYIPYELSIVSYTQTSLTMNLFLLNISTYSLIYLETPIVVSNIGTTSLDYLDEYIDSKVIPSYTPTSLSQRFAEINQAMNYTISATGAFYELGSDNQIAITDLPNQSQMADLYLAATSPRKFMFTEDGEWVESYWYDDYTGSFEKSNYGYLNHVDGYVCNFTMENGVAKIGSKETDYFFQEVPAPFYDEYGLNLSVITDEVFEGANLVQDDNNPNLYHYECINDENISDYWYDNSFGGHMLELTYQDLYTIFADNSQGTPIIYDLTMDIEIVGEEIHYDITIPLNINGTDIVDFKIEGKIADVGTTIINGLEDILDDEPSAGSSWDDWY